MSIVNNMNISFLHLSKQDVSQSVAQRGQEEDFAFGAQRIPGCAGCAGAGGCWMFVLEVINFWGIYLIYMDM